MKDTIKNSEWFKSALCLCVPVLFFVIISNISVFGTAIKGIFWIFNPIIVAFIIAYITNPIVDFFSSKICKKMKNRKAAKNIGVALTFIGITIAFLLTVYTLVPQLVNSTSMFLSNIDGYENQIQSVAQNFTGTKNAAETKQTADSISKLITIAETKIGGQTDKMVDKSMSAGKDLFNLFLSFVIAVYILIDKNRLLKETKKIFRLVLSSKVYPHFSAFGKRCNVIFTKYILCELIDALIIGVANAIFMAICGMPYIPLISFIDGVTNILPTFGPWIGAVLGFLILVLVNPTYAVIFVIFTGILQFFDGYVLKPKLFGSTLGVSSLLMLVILILGERICGIAGILLAVPAAAIIDIIYKEIIIKKLEERYKEKQKINNLNPSYNK